ncbi:MAG: hypothetical protein ACLTA1_12885, partial [Clostridia bacterium]
FVSFTHGFPPPSDADDIACRHPRIRRQDETVYIYSFKENHKAAGTRPAFYAGSHNLNYVTKKRDKNSNITPEKPHKLPLQIEKSIKNKLEEWEILPV